MLSRIVKSVKLNQQVCKNLTVVGSRSLTSFQQTKPIDFTSNGQFMNKQIRSFSSAEESERVDILEVFKAEIEAEKGNAFEPDPELLKLKKEILKKFQLKDNKGFGSVELIGTHHKESICIRFDCQDEEEIAPDYDEEGEEEEEETEKLSSKENEDEEDQEYGETGINFDVSIKKTSGETMIASCTAAETLRIHSVRYVPSGVDVDDDNLYGGPTFDTLDEQVQEAFIQYLEDRGVDEDMTYFILSYSKLKEQSEYMNWLENMTKFVTNK